MLADFRFAFRFLAKSPLFAGVVIAMIALAIGANTAIFSVLEAVIMRPLPLREPDRLVRLFETVDDRGHDQTRFSLSPTAWARWNELNTVFTGVARADFGSRTYTRAGADARFLRTSQISANFFDVLGTKPVLGRDLLPADDQPGAPPVVIIGDALWHGTLGGDPGVIGRSIELDGTPHTIVGVMGPGFRHPYRTDIWVPFAQAIDFSQVGGHGYYAPARLRPGVTVAQAEVAMRALCARINREFPLVGAATGAAVLPLHDVFVAGLRPQLIAITTAAAFVLLIAGANLASLFLSRHIEREREAGIRLALGATRVHLVRESLAQSVLLAGVGALLGLLLALWLLPVLVTLSPVGSDFSGGAIREFNVPITLNPVVLAYALGATALFAFGFGLLPALRHAQSRLATTLKGAGRGGTLDRASRRWLRLIVAAEIAAAALLLVATGFLTRSFSHLLAEKWGYATHDRLAFDVGFTARLRPGHPERVHYVDAALERLRALPGVKSAYATTPHQMFPAYSLALLHAPGVAPPARGFFIAYHRMVFPGYFRDAGIPIVAGRALDDTDRAEGRQVAVVSESFARRVWAGGTAVGQILKRGRLGDPRPPYLVVGVAADRKAIVDRDDGDVVGQWYVPYVQNPGFISDVVTFVLETGPAPETYQNAARGALAAVDPAIAASNFNTLDQLVDSTYANDRFALLLVGLFGALGLLLSAIGLYGLLAFHVARRQREIGVRSALGAQANDIVWLILREGTLLLADGLLAGLVAGRLALVPFAAELNRVSLSDPAIYGAAAVVLVTVALGAMILPARRAARIDPLVALRSE